MITILVAFLCTVSTNCLKTHKIIEKIRKKKSERLEEKTFKTFRTAFSCQSCMSMASVKVYFLTQRIETEVNIASKSF